MFCPGYDDAYHKASAVYFKLNLMLPPWLAEMLMQPKKTHTFAMKKKNTFCTSLGSLSLYRASCVYSTMYSKCYISQAGRYCQLCTCTLYFTVRLVQK